MTIKLHPCPICRSITTDVQGVVCRHCRANPPAFRGGQGRSAKDIEDTGNGSIGIVITTLLSAIVWFTVIGRCS